MITLHYALTRKHGMSLEDFMAYWRGPHAELVKSLSSQLGIVRYVQNHAVMPEVSENMQALRGTTAPFDGVAAITFKSAEDLARANVDPEAAKAQQLLAEDEIKFIDIAQSSIFFTTEHVVVE